MYNEKINPEKEKRVADAIELSDIVYEPVLAPLPPGYDFKEELTYSNYFSSYPTHYDDSIKARVYESKTEPDTIYVAYRGTDNAANFVDDISFLGNHLPFRFQKFADKVIEDTEKKYPGKKIIFTGHSAAAATSIYSALRTGCEAYAFDSPEVNFLGLDKNNWSNVFLVQAGSFISGKFEDVKDGLGGFIDVNSDHAIKSIKEKFKQKFPNSNNLGQLARKMGVSPSELAKLSEDDKSKLDRLITHFAEQEKKRTHEQMINDAHGVYNAFRKMGTELNNKALIDISDKGGALINLHQALLKFEKHLPSEAFSFLGSFALVSSYLNPVTTLISTSFGVLQAFGLFRRRNRGGNPMGQALHNIQLAIKALHDEMRTSFAKVYADQRLIITTQDHILNVLDNLDKFLKKDFLMPVMHELKTIKEQQAFMLKAIREIFDLKEAHEFEDTKRILDEILSLENLTEPDIQTFRKQIAKVSSYLAIKAVGGSDLLTRPGHEKILMKTIQEGIDSGDEFLEEALGLLAQIYLKERFVSKKSSKAHENNHVLNRSISAEENQQRKMEDPSAENNEGNQSAERVIDIKKFPKLPLWSEALNTFLDCAEKVTEQPQLSIERLDTTLTRSIDSLDSVLYFIDVLKKDKDIVPTLMNQYNNTLEEINNLISSTLNNVDVIPKYVAELFQGKGEEVYSNALLEKAEYYLNLMYCFSKLQGNKALSTYLTYFIYVEKPRHIILHLPLIALRQKKVFQPGIPAENSKSDDNNHKVLKNDSSVEEMEENQAAVEPVKAYAKHVPNWQRKPEDAVPVERTWQVGKFKQDGIEKFYFAALTIEGLELWIYDPHLDQWQSAPKYEVWGENSKLYNIDYAKTLRSAVLEKTGQIYFVIRGEDGLKSCSYDPRNGWTMLSEMNDGEYFSDYKNFTFQWDKSVNETYNFTDYIKEKENLIQEPHIINIVARCWKKDHDLTYIFYSIRTRDGRFISDQITKDQFQSRGDQVPKDYLPKFSGDWSKAHYKNGGNLQNPTGIYNMLKIMEKRGHIPPFLGFKDDCYASTFQLQPISDDELLFCVRGKDGFYSKTYNTDTKTWSQTRGPSNTFTDTYGSNQPQGYSTIRFKRVNLGDIDALLIGRCPANGIIEMLTIKKDRIVSGASVFDERTKVAGYSSDKTNYLVNQYEIVSLDNQEYLFALNKTNNGLVVRRIKLDDKIAKTGNQHLTIHSSKELEEFADHPFLLGEDLEKNKAYYSSIKMSTVQFNGAQKLLVTGQSPKGPMMYLLDPQSLEWKKILLEEQKMDPATAATTRVFSYKTKDGNEKLITFAMDSNGLIITSYPMINDKAVIPLEMLKDFPAPSEQPKKNSQQEQKNSAHTREWPKKSLEESLEEMQSKIKKTRDSINPQNKAGSHSGWLPSFLSQKSTSSFSQQDSHDKSYSQLLWTLPVGMTLYPVIRPFRKEQWSQSTETRPAASYRSFFKPVTSMNQATVAQQMLKGARRIFRK